MLPNDTAVQLQGLSGTSILRRGPGPPEASQFGTGSRGLVSCNGQLGSMPRFSYLLTSEMNLRSIIQKPTTSIAVEAMRIPPPSQPYGRTTRTSRMGRAAL
jgi:hypothetical protein